MAFEDYTKQIRISEKNLDRIKKLAKRNKVSQAKQLDKLLEEILSVLEDKLKII